MVGGSSETISISIIIISSSSSSSIHGAWSWGAWRRSQNRYVRLIKLNYIIYLLLLFLLSESCLQVLDPVVRCVLRRWRFPPRDLNGLTRNPLSPWRDLNQGPPPPVSNFLPTELSRPLTKLSYIISYYTKLIYCISCHDVMYFNMI